ncbi:MAG: 50S ribosomal protein L6 [Phycisphaeraceae bacterium]|nr:50S ribosomal protein L6 [Phycisphaerae bacterium]MBX3391376.1 50S ribosomal protein L6 [Phycisphaeraceae bacterium]HRJ49455.1 50S ribosomal protein L6 [Phycisphaerales bacterium]
MSRIGKQPVTIPAGVKVAVNGSVVSIEGPKGKLSLTAHPDVKVSWKEADKAVHCEIDPARAGDRAVRSLWGTTRANIRNMVEGVTKGYERSLQLVGTGWSAAVMGKNLKLVCGFANSIMVPIPEGITVAVDKAQGETTPIKVSGYDKQLVGQFASAVRAKRKPEPYNGKGIKYAEEVIKRKQGKQFGS